RRRRRVARRPPRDRPRARDGGRRRADDDDAPWDERDAALHDQPQDDGGRHRRRACGDRAPLSGMNAAEAERIARDLFGVAGRASPLAGERDENFRLDTAATRYVLKLHAPDTDPAELEFQELAIAHAGTPMLAARTPRTGERFARLLSWIDGKPWAEAGPWEPELLRELGRTVAR